jgi:disulfide bond formation protein DsbB
LTDYTPEQLQEGQINFGVYCVACHGPAAQGLPGLGPNLTTSYFVQTHTDAELLAFIIAGRPISDRANTSGVAMPARGGFPNLSDEDISTIIAYLRTLTP